MAGAEITRIGLIARPDSRGLGIQTKGFHDNMAPDKTLVIDPPSQQPLPIRTDWYPGAQWIHGLPGAPDLDSFLDGLDVVYTAETGYGTLLWEMARRRGVKTVLHANWEFLNRKDTPTLWAAPSLWHIDQWPAGTIHLPVPCNIDDQPMPDRATRFVVVVGRPTFDNRTDLHRNGAADVIAALAHVSESVEVTFHCQKRGYIEKLLTNAVLPGNVKTIVRSGDIRDSQDLYRGQHCLLMPRRFGGLCLPAQEAIAAGLPVVMTDISPNNLWLPQEWLVSTHHAGEFTAKQRITCHRADPHHLAAVIDSMTNPKFYQHAVGKAQRLRAINTWQELKPRYLKALS